MDKIVTAPSGPAEIKFRAPELSLAGLRPNAAAEVLTATADIMLVLDAKGVIRDGAIRNLSLARELKHHLTSPPRSWIETVTTQSGLAVEALLSEALGAGSGVRRLVHHLSAHGGDVPILYSVVPMRGSRRVLASGTDLRTLEITALLQNADPALVPAYVRALHAAGITSEALCLDVLAPAARRLGEGWEQDRCNILEVSEGVLHLQRALAELSSATAESPQLSKPVQPWTPRELRILLARAPGEMHGFGLAMVAEFFRWAGWDVLVVETDTPDALIKAVHRARSDVVGISASTHERALALAPLISEIRRRSRGTPPRILVGGPVFVEQPDLASRIGADAPALDARHAVQQVRLLCFAEMH